jgi:hypothetical protein
MRKGINESGNLFGIGGMSPKCIMLFVVFAIVTEPVLCYGTRIVEWIGERLASVYIGQHASTHVISRVFSVIFNRRTSLYASFIFLENP